MSGHEAALRTLGPPADPAAIREGWVWTVDGTRRAHAGVARCNRLIDVTIAGCSAAEMSVSDVYE